MVTEVKWIAEDEIIERLREYSRKRTGSSKALSGTINQIIEEYLSEHIKEDPPSHSDSTHTHKKGIEDIMDYIQKYNSTGITREKIEDIIKESKGMDQRTIRKYEPEVIRTLLSMGYKPHPHNNNLFLKEAQNQL